MGVKRFLNKLSTNQRYYYAFLAKECFSGFSNAEYNFSIYRYASCYTWLFHSSEFFWKALIILSGNYFDPRHEAFQTDMAKISKDLLSNDDRLKAYDILSKFPDIRRSLARYGYYEKGTLTGSPIDLFSREETESSLNDVSWLIDKLKEIHYYQIFEPPIRIGVLSGYVLTRKEKPCLYYPHSNSRKAVQWMLDLNNTKQGGSNLFQASLTPISSLSNGTFSIVINPFGEAYPEKGNAEGIGFRTIMSYIQDGGIFINSGGQPFVYSWDVNTGNHKLLVNFIPTVSNIESNYAEGRPILSINESLVVPQEALLLKRYFDVETEWDHPESGIVGPREIDIEFDELLGHEKQKTKAKVYRPVKVISNNIQPIVHSFSDKSGLKYTQHCHRPLHRILLNH